jgi:hypothetical protein
MANGIGGLFTNGWIVILVGKTQAYKGDRCREGNQTTFKGRFHLPDFVRIDFQTFSFGEQDFIRPIGRVTVRYKRGLGISRTCEPMRQREKSNVFVTDESRTGSNLLQAFRSIRQLQFLGVYSRLQDVPLILIFTGFGTP